MLDEQQLDWDFLLYEAQRRYIRADNFDKDFRQNYSYIIHYTAMM